MVRQAVDELGPGTTYSLGAFRRNPLFGLVWFGWIELGGLSRVEACVYNGRRAGEQKNDKLRQLWCRLSIVATIWSEVGYIWQGEQLDVGNGSGGVEVGNEGGVVQVAGCEGVRKARGRKEERRRRIDLVLTGWQLAGTGLGRGQGVEMVWTVGFVGPTPSRIVPMATWLDPVPPPPPQTTGAKAGLLGLDRLGPSTALLAFVPGTRARWRRFINLRRLVSSQARSALPH